MKVQLVSFSSNKGGAAIASYKVYKAILYDVNCEIITTDGYETRNETVSPSFFDRGKHFFLRLISYFFSLLYGGKNIVKQSLNIFSSSFVVDRIDYDSDIINFHWINNDTISLKCLKKILSDYHGKVIFTLHDDWFYCGSEHYSYKSERFLYGYKNKEKFYDLPYWVFSRKLNLKALFEKENVTFTVPSKWMLNRVKQSYLLKGADAIYLPNIIDTDLFKKRRTIRKVYGIPPEKKVICFGAVNGKKNPLKGFDLLISAMNYIADENLDVHLLVFGGATSLNDKLSGLSVSNVGHVSDKKRLAQIYSSSDLVVVPSRLESFGQVAAESLSCETPVVCFDNSALAEIVDDGLSGLLAKAYDARDLADKIITILNLPEEKRIEMGLYGRNKILENYSVNVVKKMILDLYK